AIPLTRPRAVLITNLFRDQLDRYGEVDSVRSLWEEAVASVPEDTIIVLNADDPAVASLGSSARGPTIFFGVDDKRLGRRSLEHAADSLYCLKCGRAYEYAPSFYAHLGHYSCPQCGVVRPSPQVTADRIAFQDLDRTQFELSTPQGHAAVSLDLGGLYNVYNALAAAAACLALGVPLPVIREALARFTPAFGRMERLDIEGRRVCLILVKNPTGFNQVLHTLAQGQQPHTLLMVLNDQIADGQDVSWIWDVDFDGLEGVKLVVSGLRAEDLALRLKYAGLAVPHELVQRDPAAALDRALEVTPVGSTLYVLPTYTAMLALQRHLAHRGHRRHYWEEG
ncbi:MAG: MurT ligase domain-containing protein, partial [Dehalococcoidia bacterium]|nr:MurT ligase domain-containing protein [Dehalococcoidia bacterium]